MDELKKFSIDDIREVATEDSVEFAIARIAVLSTRPNTHKINITEEILRRDGKSVLGKWVVAKYDKWINDTTTHMPTETIVGIVPKDANITFEETEDGYVVMYVDAIISKIYATEVYKLFTKDNFRNVSVEMSTFNDVELPDGTTDITGLCIYGITVLGKKVNGSCPDANMKIVQFSEQQANEFYDKAFAFNKIKDMANDLIQFADNQLKLNETKSKGEIMEENKNLSEQPKDEDIIMAEPNQQEIDDTENIKGDDKVDEVKGEPKEEKVELAEAKEDDTQEKEMSCGDSKEMEEEQTEKEEPTEEKEMSEVEETKEMSEVELEGKEEEVEKTFSEQCVEFADEEHKEFVEKLFSCELKDMVEQVIELKKFMETTVKANTEKRFAEIMVEPKLCLGEKAYNVLFEEGSNLSLEELDSFEMKVKAFCEDAPKKQNDTNDELLRFACDDTNVNINTELSVDELIKKYN